MPAFAFVANGGDPAVVVEGNEEVLVGRLEDAAFAHTKDVARGIRAMLAELPRVSFLEGAGSLAQKAERVREVSGQLCRPGRGRPGCARRRGPCRGAVQGRPGVEPGGRVLRSAGLRGSALCS